jgi:hypothetical protein
MQGATLDTRKPQVLQISVAVDVLDQVIRHLCLHPICMQLQLGEVLQRLQDCFAQQNMPEWFTTAAAAHANTTQRELLESCQWCQR